MRGIAQVLRGRNAVIAVPFFWLFLFFLVPFAIVLKISLAEAALGVPPFSALFSWVGDAVLQVRLNLGNYRFLGEDPLYVGAYLARPGLRGMLLLLIILPFWTSFLIRVYAWIGLLKGNGLVNQLLLATGLIDQPLTLLHTDFAVYLGIVYSYLPFMILPLYATLVRQDPALLEAAADLGCRPFRAFLSVTLPLSMPGVIAGSMLVFIPAVGEFVIPDLLGGPDTLMIGKVLWSEFFTNRDWPLASAVAVAMLLLLVVPVVIFQRAQEQEATPEHQR